VRKVERIKGKLQPQRLFTPVSIPCYDFVSEDDIKGRVTVIIAPIRLMELEDGSLGVSYACSRGSYCHDPHCRYSKTAKKQIEHYYNDQT
jgi:hypothetical protein